MRSGVAKMHDDGLNAHAAPEGLSSKHRAAIDPCATAITAVSAAGRSCEVPAMPSGVSATKPEASAVTSQAGDCG